MFPLAASGYTRVTVEEEVELQCPAALPGEDVSRVKKPQRALGMTGWPAGGQGEGAEREEPSDCPIGLTRAHAALPGLTAVSSDRLPPATSVPSRWSWHPEGNRLSFPA